MDLIGFVEDLIYSDVARPGSIMPGIHGESRVDVRVVETTYQAVADPGGWVIQALDQ